MEGDALKVMIVGIVFGVVVVIVVVDVIDQDQFADLSRAFCSSSSLTLPLADSVS